VAYPGQARRSLGACIAGNEFTVTATEQIAGRLDVNAVKQYMGESWHRFEVPTISTVIRIKAVTRFAAAA